VTSPGPSDATLAPSQRPSAGALLLPLALVAVIALGLRMGTHAATIGLTFDEPYITVPILNLIEQGWSMRTAIDFDETKGPALIWPYALLSEVIGSSLADLRLISVLFFVLGALPLLDIARRCGVSGGGLWIVAILYAALPYQAALAQLVMSEPSYVAFALAACWLFMWGIDAKSKVARIAAPVLFTVTLSILVHNRVHAAAMAPAVCLVAFGRGGWRGALPWVIACGAAALSRVPLLVHWGGIVSPRFQGLHATGIRMAGVTYLLASFAPLLMMFIPEAWTMQRVWARRLMALGAVVGLGLALVAMPRLDETISNQEITANMYSGITATAVRMLSTNATIQSIAIGALAVLGGAALGGLAAVAWRRPVSQSLGALNRLQFWMLATGMAMYVASVAPVYDRYVLAWSFLLPVVWLTELARPRLVAQSLLMAAISGYLCWRWLM